MAMKCFEYILGGLSPRRGPVTDDWSRQMMGHMVVKLETFSQERKDAIVETLEGMIETGATPKEVRFMFVALVEDP